MAWSGCAFLRGPLCAGEALLEARTQASVALFKLGAHSATLRPEFGGPKSLRCCCAKGVGHRAQLMLRARRGDRETTTLSRYCVHQHHKSSLSCSSLRRVTTTEFLESSCHVQNQDGDSDGAITGMIRGKWSGGGERQPARYGIVEQVLCGWRWAAALAGGPAEALAELLPQARSRMTHVE